LFSIFYFHNKALILKLKIKKYWSKFYRTLYRKYLVKERTKKIKRVLYATKKVIREHPEFGENFDFVKKQFEQKYGYKPAKPYTELIRKPAPDELPKRLKEKYDE
jgi:hypothetical protein